MASKHLTPEQENFVRLTLAGVDEARVVLGYVLHSQIPPEDLVKKIQAKKEVLLKGNRKLSPEQLKLCYIPGPLVPDYKTFDITLLYKLIRNLCPLLKPSQEWGKEPRPTEINTGDDIERLRNFRNELSHGESSSVPDDVFNSKWTELENIFKRIQRFLPSNENTEQMMVRLTYIKSTDFGWRDYEKSVLRTFSDIQPLTLQGDKCKRYGESACFVAKYEDEEMSHNCPITWLRIKGNTTEQLDTSAERYRGSSSQQLVIAKVSSEDEGQYRATVSREVKGTHIQIPSNTVYLTVTGDVPILDIENAVSENDSITISYKMSTNDESPDVERVVWSKDGKPLDLNADKYSGGGLPHTYLAIHSPTSADIGQYICQVFNAVGSVKKTIILNSPSASINGKPTAVVGDPVTITTTIRSSPTLLSAKWQTSSDGTIGNFTDVDINDSRYYGSTADHRDPKLCIPKTTREDGIFYRLVVSNGLGQCESNKVFLKLVGDVPSAFVHHETHISEQTRVKLVCIIRLDEQSPEVSRVLWTKDGREIDIRGSGGKYTGGSIADPSLTINEVNLNDNGKYQCCASNSVGDMWSESILLGPPTIELDNPILDDTHGTVTYIATVRSIPLAMKAKWKVKEDLTGNYKTIDISDPLYRGSTVSMPYPKLIRNGYRSDHLESYELEVFNSIGSSTRNTEAPVKRKAESEEEWNEEESEEEVKPKTKGRGRPVKTVKPRGEVKRARYAESSEEIDEFKESEEEVKPKRGRGKRQSSDDERVKGKKKKRGGNQSDDEQSTSQRGRPSRSAACKRGSYDSSAVGHKKKHKRRMEQGEDYAVIPEGGTSGGSKIKLKLKIGGQTMGTKSLPSVEKTENSGEDSPIIDITDETWEEHTPDDKKESVPDEVKDQIEEQEIDFLLNMSPEHEKYRSGIAQILKVPVELLGMSEEDIKTFVRNYKEGSTKVYCGRAMVVGCFGAGKTTLVKKLKGEDVSIPPDSTRGLDVHTNIFIVDEDETCMTVNKNRTSEQSLQINRETLGSAVVKTPSNAERSNPKPDSELPSTHIPPAKNDTQPLAQTQEKKNDLPFRTSKTGKSDNIPSKDGQNSKKTGKDPVKHPKIDQITENDVNKTDKIQQNLGQKKGSSRSNVTNKPVKTISLLDFAGQDAYYACHHIFLSPRTSYMLVTDMSKELTERPTNAVQMKGIIYSDWTYQDYINHWLGSIHTYSSETAPVILVQSHSDKTEKKENDYFRKVLGGVADTLRVHLSSKKKFAVEKDTDKNIEELKSSMLSVVKGQRHWGESIPTSWVHLEAFLVEIKKEHMVWKKEDLWKKLQSESSQPNLRNLSKEDMTTALKLFNDIGIILYTSSSESIILDVQWFVDAFKNIITDEEHAKHDIARYYEDWEKFNENGILSKNLVREIWRESMSFTKYADDLILHMIRLGMIAEMEKEKTYYVPCMNKQKYDEDVLHNCVCSSTICFMFEYLPLVIFHRLIATCMTKDGWEIWNGNNVEKTGQTSECVFHTAAMLTDKDDLKMLIGITEKKKHKKITHPYSIEIQGFVFKDQQMQKQFPQRKLERIREHLKDLTSCFEANSSMIYEIGYRCSIAPFSDTPDSHIITESEKECTSCRKTEGIDELKSFWMADATHDGNLGDDNAAQQSTQHDDKGILSDSGLVYVASRLGAEWSLVAVSLGLKQAEIDQIKLDNPFSTQTQISTALQKWRDCQSDQTENTLLQQVFGALAICDRKDLVEEIQQKYNIQEDKDLAESEPGREDRTEDEKKKTEKKSGVTELTQAGEDGMKEDKDLAESEPGREDRTGDEKKKTEKESGDTELAQAGEDGMKGQMERPFLDEARFTADIHTGYDRLRSVSCVSEERVWTCGGINNTMKLLTVQGQLLSSVQTKSGNGPCDITVTRDGDLVYTDTTDRSINLVKNKKIRTLITLRGWYPGYIYSTTSGDLLVTMNSDDGEQSKVVRYSGSTEKQSIQYDDQRRPLYTSGYNLKYISENQNLDICVADFDARAVVVVNQSGTLRFRYTGHPSNTGESFRPCGIATDSQGHILAADCHNGRIHILDQDGQFLRYIHNLQIPHRLCVDSRDNLFVAEWGTAKVKRIQYLESQR